MARSSADRAPDVDEGASDELAAGAFATWLIEVEGAIRGDNASHVPCGTCTACCTSSQFVHIGPDETDALGHIPRTLTFPAPGLPRGHVLLGYDERGHCPMLVDGACSIYEHRPRTCRTYDCRVFAATGLAPDEVKVDIVRRAERWRFELATDADRVRLAAVRAAAGLLAERSDEIGTDLPTNPTQLAVLAIAIHAVFLRDGAAADDLELVEPSIDAVRDAVRRTRADPPTG